MAQRTRRIVVGMDDSEVSVAALRWAIRQARLTRAIVEVFHAFEVPMPVPYSPIVRVPAAEIATDAQAELDQAIAAQLDPYEKVRVRSSVMRGRPVDVLVDAARGADLLVLGSSGAPGIMGVLAGSTDYAVIHRAPCPLVLVPHREGPRNDPSAKGPSRPASARPVTPGRDTTRSAAPRLSPRGP